MSNHKPVIGLIGGMGSGKSLVADELARHGGRVISGDRAGHEALTRPEVMTRIKERWGQAVFDQQGNVDRRQVAARVFADDKERKHLEGLVFPYIEKRLTEEIEAARKDASVSFIVLDAAIMLEAGWDQRCDRLVYVDAPLAKRLERLARQRGWSESEVSAREKAQWPPEEKKRRADWIIDNSRTPQEIAGQVQDLVAKWNLKACKPAGDSSLRGCG